MYVLPRFPLERLLPNVLVLRLIPQLEVLFTPPSKSVYPLPTILTLSPLDQAISSALPTTLLKLPTLAFAPNNPDSNVMRETAMTLKAVAPVIGSILSHANAQLVLLCKCAKRIMHGMLKNVNASLVLLQFVLAVPMDIAIQTLLTLAPQVAVLVLLSLVVQATKGTLSPLIYLLSVAVVLLVIKQLCAQVLFSNPPPLLTILPVVHAHRAPPLLAVTTFLPLPAAPTWSEIPTASLVFARANLVLPNGPTSTFSTLLVIPQTTEPVQQVTPLPLTNVINAFLAQIPNVSIKQPAVPFLDV